MRAKRFSVALVIAVGLALAMTKTAQAFYVECGWYWTWPLC